MNNKPHRIKPDSTVRHSWAVERTAVTKLLAA
jgi:hypothetical protein